MTRRRHVRHFRCTRLALAVNFVGTALLCFGTAQADTVLQLSGGQQRGKIEKSSKDGLLVDGKPIRSDDIRYVLFSDEPKEMRSIRDAVSKGSFGKAEQTLAKLDLAKISGDLPLMDAKFYVAYVKAKRAMQTGNDKGAAAKQLLAYVKSHPKSFHFYDAAEALGELATSMGQEKEAARFFGALEKSSSPSIRARGMSRLAEAFMARGDYGEALKRYEAMLQASPADSDGRTAALLGKALCQAQTGQGEVGIAAVEEIIAQTSPSKNAVMARAYIALGACYRVSGKDNAAVLAYLHIDLLYAKQADQHAEALFYLGELWGKTGHPDRAAQAKALLKSKYGGSAWASK